MDISPKRAATRSKPNTPTRPQLRPPTISSSRVILFNLCGHGNFDMQAYLDYAAGKLRDHAYSQEEVAMALAGLPSVG